MNATVQHGARVLVTVLALAAPLLGELISYDGTVFPEDAGLGWVHLEFINQADRWLEDGWLVQAPILLPCPPSCTTQDFYRRELEDHADIDRWYLTWTMETNGPLSIGAVAPSGIVAGGTAGVLYHFTIGDNQVAFLRDAQIPLVVVDFEPGPHVFHLELRNDVQPPTYTFRIDGQIADFGVAEAEYPTADSRVTFGASAAIVDSISRWDLIEFGPIEPEPIPAVSTWGAVALALLTLTAATLVFDRRRHRLVGHAQ